MTILLAMTSRGGRFIAPEDVAAAVLSQGADETRAELVRLMAECWGSGCRYAPTDPSRWMQMAWTIQETERGIPA